MNVFDLMYYRYNKKAIDAGIKYIKKISVKKFIDWYIKKLTEKHDDFKLIIQNSEYADILTWKGNVKYLFRYHRCQMVFSEQFDSFETLIDVNNVNRAFYITCGVFEEDILRHKKTKGIFSNCKVYTINGFNLVKKILGFKRKWKSEINSFDIFDLYSP
jgi:hypothetical protein